MILPDPAQALERLAGSEQPHLIAVRHHSPVLAAAVPALLEAADPDAVLIELPQELEPWLRWLGHPDTTAPVALTVAGPAGERLGFYPFADFSPELAALRWALAHNVAVHAIDLPSSRPRPSSSAPDGTIVPALLRTSGVTDFEELWDRLVETRSYGAQPERIRRAALALGWALRLDAHPQISPADRTREAWMRQRITEVDARRPAAVIGAFHAPALAGMLLGEPTKTPDPVHEVVTALIPYTFELLDSRSGYPAGIRDPEWQQAVLTACGDPAAIEHAAITTLARVCAELRAAGQVAGTPDTKAAYRLAADLAALRGLPAPGRRELIEGLQTALGQGEQLGRARAVAQAAQRALVGVRRGTLAPEAPRSGLSVHVEDLLAELGLPGPKTPPQPAELRLDPARSPLDLRRHLALTRLTAAGVTYGDERELTGVGDVRAVGRAWTVRWQPLTAATLELAAAYGMTLDQAAEGALRTRRQREELTPALLLSLIGQAADAALPALTTDLATALRADLLPVAGLPELMAAHDLIERITAGHIPGLHVAALAVTPAELAAAAVAAIEGIAGSDDPADARALLHLVHLVERGAAGTNRLTWQLRRLATAAPLPQGAATAALVLLGADPTSTLASALTAWAEAPGDESLAKRLTGALTVAGPVVEAAADVLGPLARTIEGWPDPAFLQRLPALREGFDTLSPAARQRFLDTITDHHGEISTADLQLDTPPQVLATHALADLTGRTAVQALDPTLLPPNHPTSTPEQPPATHPDHLPSDPPPPHQFASPDPAEQPPESPPHRSSGGAQLPGQTASPGPAEQPPESPPHRSSGGAQLPGQTASPGPAEQPPESPPHRSSGGAQLPGQTASPGPAEQPPEVRPDRLPSDPPPPHQFPSPGPAELPVESPPDPLSGGAQPPDLAAPRGPAEQRLDARPDRRSGGAYPQDQIVSRGPGEQPVEARPDRLPQDGVLAESDPPGTAERPSGVPGRLPGDVGGPGRLLGAVERWRLVLGRERERLSGLGGRAARGLDELYGHGRGEGADRGGSEQPYPSAREWSEELDALFGDRVRDEVLGRAASRGRTDALLELDPERVAASIDLLQQVLTLAGSLPEARLGRLRRLVERLVAELTRELARRLRPALTGLATPRPVRRPVGPLDLGRTVRANLHTARYGTDGSVTVLPERPVFRTRARRSADWHVYIAVDVSGSMERSTIYSALVASVLHGVPALSVHFVTFSTEVIDLTERAADPLGLLLEISVGGGTDIGKGLAYVRERLTVPGRSIVAVVTDFEEGGSVGRLLGEVRALAESGAQLLGLAALDDSGQPVFNRAIAGRVAEAGMPVAALSPAELAGWIGERVRA